MSITLLQALENLKPYIGQELSQYAQQFNITIKKQSGGYNKGWKGQVIERLAGLNGNNKQAPNGLGFECKTTCFVVTKDLLKAKETMAITMFHQRDYGEEFLESHFWSKLKILIFCAISWDGSYAETGTLLKISTFQAINLDDDGFFKKLKSDYNTISQYFRDCKINNSIPHTISGKLVQAELFMPSNPL